jgi:hypothetical protein
MNQAARPLSPILTAHLFPKIEGMLLRLLSSISPEDWDIGTIAPVWKVKDVVAHLLDTHLRKLSIVRDRCALADAAVHSSSKQSHRQVKARH